MHTAQAILYAVGVGLLILAAGGVVARVNLAILGAACLALGYTLPVIMS